MGYYWIFMYNIQHIYHINWWKITGSLVLLYLHLLSCNEKWAACFQAKTDSKKLFSRLRFASRMLNIFVRSHFCKVGPHTIIIFVEYIYIYIFYITPRIFPKIRWVTEASYNPTSRGYNFRTDPAAHQNTEVRGQTPGAMRMNHLSSG